MNSHALFQFLFYLLPKKKEEEKTSSFIACPAYSSLIHSLCMLIARDVERHFCSKRQHRKHKNAPFFGLFVFDFSADTSTGNSQSFKTTSGGCGVKFLACYHAVRISWKHSAAPSVRTNTVCLDSLLFRVWAILGVCFTNCVFFFLFI